MSPRLRAGLIGAGAMGRNHLRVLAELPGVETTVVVDPVATSAELGVPVVTDLGEAAARMDLAILAAPSELHELLGLQLARLGVPTLIEKPLATTSTGAARLVAAFERAGVPAAVGHIERFNPVVDTVRTHLPIIGTVLAASTVRIGPLPARPMSVGVVPDLLVHDIDLVCWLLGAEYATVTACALTDPGRPCEDEVRVAARLQCLREAGASETPDTCMDHVAVDQHAGRRSERKDRSLRFVGERGTLDADLIEQSVVLRSADGSERALPVRRGQPLAGELAAWCETVRTGRPHPVLATLADGLQAVEVAEAVLASAAAGGPIDLEGVAA